MQYERRRTARVRVQLEARWEGDGGLDDGIVSDIGFGGCFILTSGQVKSRELIRVEISLPAPGWLCLWGEVVEYSPEIGFSLRFTTLGEAEKNSIRELFHRTNRGEFSRRRRDESSLAGTTKF